MKINQRAKSKRDSIYTWDIRSMAATLSQLDPPPAARTSGPSTHHLSGTAVHREARSLADTPQVACMQLHCEDYE